MRYSKDCLSVDAIIILANAITASSFSSSTFAPNMPRKAQVNKFDNPAVKNVPFDPPLWKQEVQRQGITPGCFLTDLPPFEEMKTYWEKRLWLHIDAHSHPQGVSPDTMKLNQFFNYMPVKCGVFSLHTVICEISS